MAAAPRAFPPQPLNFEDEAGIVRDLPSSPPNRIHKLMIDVDDLNARDFLRLNDLYCHRTPIDEWILGVNNPQSGVGFALTRLFSLMRLFRPTFLMIQQSARILESEAFRSFLKTSPQLSILVIDCSQDYELSKLCLNQVQEIRINILQDQHIESVSNLAGAAITKLHLWVSHGITPLALQGLVIPTKVHSLSLSTQQVSFEQFQMLSLAIKRHESIRRLEISWRGSNPADLLGLQPSPSIRGLELYVSKFVTVNGTLDFVNTMRPFLNTWSHLRELRINPTPNIYPSRTQLSKSEYLRFFDIIRQTPFTNLRMLTLRVGPTLEKEYCESLVKVVQTIQTLRKFDLAQSPASSSGLDKTYQAKFDFYCDLHSLPENILSREIPLRLWPSILEKSKAVPSILFHLMQGKNDMLIPRAGKSRGKRKRGSE